MKKYDIESKKLLVAKTKKFKTHNNLPESTRTKIIALLNQSLVDTLDLGTQVKQAHWNIKGMQFIALHELFDELYARLNTAADELAERVTALGGVAMGTARMIANHSNINEYPANVVDGKDHVKALVQRYGTLASAAREAIDLCDDLDDDGTQDLYTQISRDLDKDLWFLEAHIQAG